MIERNEFVGIPTASQSDRYALNCQYFDADAADIFFTIWLFSTVKELYRVKYMLLSSGGCFMKYLVLSGFAQKTMMKSLDVEYLLEPCVFFRKCCFSATDDYEIAAAPHELRHLAA